MAYDLKLAERIKTILQDTPGVSEKKMFGGVGFLVNGNMACGVIKDELVVRVGEVEHVAALKKEHTRQFDFSGKPMKGWLYVGKAGFEREGELKDWVELGVNFAQSLPPK